MNDWRGITLFFIKICLSSLFLERFEIGCKWDRGRQEDERHGHRLAEDCYLDFFLTNAVILYSEPYIFASLTGGSQSGSVRGHLAPAPSWLSLAALWTSWLPNRLTDRPQLTVTQWVPVYIWFYNAYVSFRFVIHMICLHPRIACFPVITFFTTQEHLVSDIPDWRLWQWFICNTITSLSWKYSPLSGNSLW